MKQDGQSPRLSGPVPSLAVGLGYRLRAPEPRDVPLLLAMKNDRSVAEGLGSAVRSYSESEIRHWVWYHRSARNERLWVVSELGQDDAVGHVGLYQIDLDAGSAEYGILLSRSTWGVGLGTAASRVVLDWGFNCLDLDRIELGVLSTNRRAKRLYLNLGFTCEGCKRQAVAREHGLVDLDLMSIRKAEWQIQSGDGLATRE